MKVTEYMTDKDEAVKENKGFFFYGERDLTRTDEESKKMWRILRWDVLYETPTKYQTQRLHGIKTSNVSCFYNDIILFLSLLISF